MIGDIRKNDMDLNLLKVFVSVANNKSISIAANELKCAQSNVTSRVKQLEKVLGLELFIGSKGCYFNIKWREILPTSFRNNT